MKRKEKKSNTKNPRKVRFFIGREYYKTPDDVANAIIAAIDSIMKEQKNAPKGKTKSKKKRNYIRNKKYYLMVVYLLHLVVLYANVRYDMTSLDQ